MSRGPTKPETWVAQRVFHVPYVYFVFIGAALRAYAAAGVYGGALLSKRPDPHPFLRNNDCVAHKHSSYAAIVTCGLSAFYGIELAKQWKQVSADERKRIYYAFALIAGSLLLSFAILLPKSDASLVLDASHASIPRRVIQVGEGVNGAFTDAILTAVVLVVASIWAFRKNALLLLTLTVGGVSFEYGFLPRLWPPSRIANDCVCGFLVGSVADEC